MEQYLLMSTNFEPKVAEWVHLLYLLLLVHCFCFTEKSRNGFVAQLH